MASIALLLLPFLWKSDRKSRRDGWWWRWWNGATRVGTGNVDPCRHSHPCIVFTPASGRSALKWTMMPIGMKPTFHRFVISALFCNAERIPSIVIPGPIFRLWVFSTSFGVGPRIPNRGEAFFVSNQVGSFHILLFKNFLLYASKNPSNGFLVIWRREAFIVNIADY